ncbi:1-(5-phosphoribosyl)-5-[(5-phosphoribosylamino)methylideneamino]imidazole-4-carboxamide isomerase [Phototrophicus methaneseepsis]|uniref:1-(5-phosphoribosyl)-5-[(5-phosphoribosylamino)methylideneamino] imidazole-4-carboxamide isomerase n=1 Tax=Phototrophicus methaneseepsis TaxID=2710758 RepID=A0A7S8ICX9_9CHLR|nr:1-(5-phosphoribosyl)-5-[(5-phosphoribosylamino)methylideneamino]imidazole-4-carboxamide isomerase [Phototrophicus methaneseepsis]QPC80956.1 1-(5-phosphoribosyl)-5-[(5-phosphoribosylamino)methylideneamino]imidazole-4-carboxamide isomerase [Phototrophicus methaneseepsis]
MIIYPAIDLRGGKVVRLKEGDPNQQTVFSEDPIATAQIWQDQGAVWLHMVNLDGAFADANENGTILEQAAQLGLNVQFGGGLRSLDDIANAIDRGASRVVLGTLALKDPAAVEEAIARYGAERICVALDARDGKVTTHGWMETSDLTPIEVGQAMAGRGVRHALFTDVSRDGMLTGTNTDATIELAQETGLQVIASGGVATLEELTTLANSGAIAGAVIGMALYTKQFTLVQAIEAVQEV